MSEVILQDGLPFFLGGVYAPSILRSTFMALPLLVYAQYLKIVFTIAKILNFLNAERLLHFVVKMTELTCNVSISI